MPLLRPYTVPGRGTGLKIIGGAGSYVTDSSGRTYLDAAGGLWNLTLGLGSQSLHEAITKQVKTLAYGQLFDCTHTPAERLAEALLSQYGSGMKFAYLSTTGSSAVEVAITAAQLHQKFRGHEGRRQIVTLDRGYHGSSSMTRAASGSMDRELSEWGLHQPQFLRIPSYAEEGKSLEALARLVGEDHHRIAAVLMEPVLGTGGIVVPTHSYCEAVSSLCEKHGVMLLIDEVATSGGRCGAYFASQTLGFRPAAIAMSKGLTAGHLPLGATLFSESILSPLISAEMTVPFGSTQDGNPITCAAALATLEIVTHPALVQRINCAGEALRVRLSELIGHGVVSDVRGLGLMIGIDLTHISGNRLPFSESEAAIVRNECREEGLLVYHFDAGLSLFPSLLITDDEITELVDILTVIVTNQI